MWSLLLTAINDWFRHRSPRLGAALAYYAVFSLGPLLLIVTAVAGIFFGPDAVRGSLTSQFRGLLGESGSQAIDAMIKGAASASSGRAVAGIGIVLLLVAALGVVVAMKDALNTIWEVEDPANPSWWWYVRTYVISFAAILALGALLTISLVISTGTHRVRRMGWHSSGRKRVLADCQSDAVSGLAFSNLRSALQVFSRRSRCLARCLARLDRDCRAV